MKLRTIAFPFLVLSALFVVGCCSGELSLLPRESGFAASTSYQPAAAPAADGGEVVCTLCAGLGVDLDTDAAMLGVGFVADNLLPNEIGAEADLEIGQGSEGSDDYAFDEFSTLSKTEGFGSDYTVIRGSLHARYPVQIGDNSDLTVVPLAGLGLYHWAEKDCDDGGQGWCTWDTTTLDVGAELRWNDLGLKLWLPVSGGGPDLALRVRYHLPLSAIGG